MKQRLLKTVLVCFAFVSDVSVASAGSCRDLFRLMAETPEANFQALAAWRLSQTHADATGSVAATSPQREAWLKEANDAMLRFLFAVRDPAQITRRSVSHDTPEMVFAAAEGVRVVPADQAAYRAATTIPLIYSETGKQAYHYNSVPRILVSGLEESGILRGTLLLPASGHTGRAYEYAQKDSYDIYLEEVTGTNYSSARKTAKIASNARSLDVITAQEIAVQLAPGKVYQITYHRSGSGGPGGFAEGRVLQIVWDGN